jgi:hypothetical protein
MFAFRLASLCVLLLASVPPAYADTKTLTADASYIMGDGETPDFAEARALQKAKQIALEEAGTYVQSYTKVQNLDLTTEEIQTIAGGVLQVEVLEKTRSLVADGLRFYIKIKATVTTEKMEELARRIKGKNVAEEYQKLQADYARLSHELESWKQRAAKTPQGPERNAALDQIREGEKTFSRVQQREADLFQRLVSGQQLIEHANRDKEVIDKLLETILISGYIVTVGDVQAVADSEKSDQLVLRVPLTIQVSKNIQEVVSYAASVLGGSVQPDMVLFEQKVRVGSENRAHATVTLVRLAKDSELKHYFQQGVSKIGLQLMFPDSTSNPSNCLLDVYGNPDNEWRRIFTYSTFDWMLSMSKRRPYPLAEYIVIVGDGARVVAEHRIQKQSAGKLTGVNVRTILITNELFRGPHCNIAQ